MYLLDQEDLVRYYALTAILNLKQSWKCGLEARKLGLRSDGWGVGTISSLLVVKHLVCFFKKVMLPS